MELAEAAGERRERGRAGSLPERVGERQVGQPGADKLDAAPIEDRRAAAPPAPGQLREERRLPDPCPALDEDGAPAALGRSVERRLEAGELVGTPEEPCGLDAPPLGLLDGRFRPGLEARVLVQDRELQRLEGARRLDAELVVEGSPEALVRGERLGLATRAVERDDQLPMKALAQRVLRCESVEFARHVGMPAGGEVGVDALLEAAEAQLLEMSALDAREGLGELGESRTAPQLERVGEEPRGGRRVAGLERGSALGANAVEAAQVESVVVVELNQVAGRPSRQDAGRQHLAELRHEDLDHLDRRVGHVIAPEIVDEPVHRHGPARVEKQPGEQRAGLPAAERERLRAVSYLQRAEKPELHTGSGATLPAREAAASRSAAALVRPPRS